MLFTTVALAQLGLVNGGLRPATFLPAAVLALCGGGAAYFLYISPHPRGAGPATVERRDFLLPPLIFFLSGFGLVLLARLEPAFVNRQLLWLVAATVLFIAVALAPPRLERLLRRYKYGWFSGGLLLLAATLLFGVNPSGFGPRLWLEIGPVYIQPSEPLKLLLIIFLAGYMADRQHTLIEVETQVGKISLPPPSYFGPMLLMWGLSIVLLVWQRDLGAALLFFGTFVGMVYAATGRRRYMWAGGFLLIIAGGIGYWLFDVVRLRFEAFLNPWLDPAGRSFQIVQALLAFASGGIFGEGLGQGLPTVIPVVHTDFVFAAIGEEYGLLGAVAVLLLFALLISRAFRIALSAATDFERLLAAGIGTMLGLQTIVITAGTLKLMPLTGVTLPFVSYGGSSLVTSFVMVALLCWVGGRGAGDRREEGKIPLLGLGGMLLNGLLVVAGGLVLWQVVAAPYLVSRADNPRPIVLEQQIRRGRLLTEDGTPLAETMLDENGLAVRRYPYPNLSSVTGYYSLRYGAGGTEAAFDPILRGTAGRAEAELWLGDLLHRIPAGQDVTLTISLPAQLAADKALGEREGAVVVLEVESGAIVVMSSYPTYDPNRLDELWEELRRQDRRAPLLNRATQGLFPVGDLARLVGLIGLAEAGTTIPPAPLAAPLPPLLAPLGRPGYLATIHQLALDQPVPGLPSYGARLPDFDAHETIRDLAVSPLHMARVIAAAELEGRLPAPILSRQAAGAGTQTPGVSPATALYVRSVLPQVAPQVVGLSGQATPKDTGREALSWFVGLAPAEAYPSPPPTPVAPLPLDPNIDLPTPPPAQRVGARARYAIVVVVATHTPHTNPALGIARAALDQLGD
jgi:cell division protein FtsW (lipid II flippase)